LYRERHVPAVSAVGEPAGGAARVGRAEQARRSGAGRPLRPCARCRSDSWSSGR